MSEEKTTTTVSVNDLLASALTNAGAEITGYNGDTINGTTGFQFTLDGRSFSVNWKEFAQGNFAAEAA